MTVIGYSVNDVIVIYDRIRENLSLHPRRALRDNINIALNETFTRSINTSLSTIVSLIGVLIFGTAQIWNFAAAMAIGVVAATITSTFLASWLVLWFEDWKRNRSAGGGAKATA
jgi:preprotein translocase SecF subunit